MEKNIVNEAFSRGLLIMIAVLFLLPQGLYAQTLEIKSDDIACELLIWDVSGSYEDDGMDELLDCSLILNLTQDAKGKITGYGSTSCSGYYWEIGSFDIVFTYDVKGSIKQKNDVATVKMGIKIKGSIDLPDQYIYDVKFSASEKLITEIDAGTQTIAGVVKVKACVRGAGCARDTLLFSESLPFDMDGTWDLYIDWIDDRSGLGSLELSNGNTSYYSVKRRFNAKKYESKLTLKGVDESRGCKLSPKIDEYTGDVLSITGKVLGQKIVCK